ncbi:hypothetical protein HDU98_001964 [Podochytrium sp. JEL0797]|nr:hypothetical protein HDU98_001964 [Podochytrium sp. JEL0797]
MALEQSVLSHFTAAATRTTIFAWYNLIGYVATGFGSLLSGVIVSYLTETSIMSTYFGMAMLVESPSFHIANQLSDSLTVDAFSKLSAYRLMIGLYGVLALVLMLAFSHLSPQAEHQHASENVRVQGRTEQTPLLAPAQQSQNASQSWLPGFTTLTPESRHTVVKLCFLFTLDSFAGSVITGSLLAYWFNQNFGVGEAYLGGILFIANIIAGVSSLLAGAVSSRFGMVNTMVFTHLPSNVLMILVPLMPNLFWATTMLFLRYSISQMDVGPRQAYVASIVKSDERTAVIGLTNIVKSVGSALGPMLAGWLMQNKQFDACFYVCGGLKIVYDLLLLWSVGGGRREREALSRGS